MPSDGAPRGAGGDALRVGLVGDHDPGVTAHRAIPLAIDAAACALGRRAACEWLGTDALAAGAPLAAYDALWCVPASPYHSMDGALCAIRHARESGVPFLGTCGGFQHAVVEYARHVLGWADAEHAETVPGARRAVIAPLACALVEVARRVRLQPGSRLAAAYGCAAITEEYHCSYGLNPEFMAALLGGPLRATAAADDGEVRAVELDGHPYFVATLFQPERAALRGERVPLAEALLAACAA